jgi:hypothetical protein
MHMAHIFVCHPSFVVLLQETVLAWSAADIVADLMTIPLACFYNATADDSNVLPFLKANPLQLFKPLEMVPFGQPTNLSFACVVATKPENTVREPGSRSRFLPMCSQPWGPNYFIGNMLNWNGENTLFVEENSPEDGWFSRTVVCAVSCLRHMASLRVGGFTIG